MINLLCKFGIHKWKYRQWLDGTMVFPRFKVANSTRICKRCGIKQWMKRNKNSNRIKYGKYITTIQSKLELIYCICGGKYLNGFEKWLENLWVGFKNGRN